jgi:hypothetical protein
VIKTGLTASEKVVLDGLARLQPGMDVDAKVIPLKPRAAADSPASTAIRAPAAAEATAK